MEGNMFRPVLKTVLSVIIALIVGLWSWTASAGTITLVADNTSVVAGEPVTFNVLIPASDILVPDFADPSSLGFAGGGAFFRSGDGQTQVSTNFNGLGEEQGIVIPTTDLVTLGPVTFTYSAAGEYVATAQGELDGHTFTLGEPDPNGRPYASFDVSETITVGVPEPSTWAMMLLGFAGLGFAFRRAGLNPLSSPAC
jgi:hypothetical protein